MPKLFFLILVFPLAAYSQPDNTAANTPATVVDTAYVENLLTTTQAELEQLASDFINHWNDTAVACEQSSGRLFGNMSAECRQIRAAIRNGEFLDFASTCMTHWSDTMAAVNTAPILTSEFENNRDKFASMISQYSDARLGYCFLEDYADSNPALYDVFEEAKNSGANGFSNFSNVQLMEQIIDGQRRLIDQQMEQERRRNQEILEQ